MEWTEREIRHIIQDMIEENPLACRSLLSISEIEFTDSVETMAVTLSEKSILKINLDFCNNYLRNENNVKALLLHEFLHVLLLHTVKYEYCNPLLNVALDAIINSIIYRYKGMEYAEFFASFYKWEMISFLLRPEPHFTSDNIDKEWMDIHKKIYDGKYCADDLYELLIYLKDRNMVNKIKEFILLGNHNPSKISKEMEKLLDETMNKMDGTLIWNSTGARGIGNKLAIEEQEINKYKKSKWDKSTLSILKKCLLPDEKLKNNRPKSETYLPVLSNSDRRSIAKYKYNGMIPFSRNESVKITQSQLANIYLDVSGSMNEEIDGLISLFYQFRQFIKTPLWVFSNEVSEASFKNGKVIYGTTGGTSIGPVFDHIRKNKIKKSLIVTDGYVEDIGEETLRDLSLKNIKVLISANGDPEVFIKNHFYYRQLEQL